MDEVTQLIEELHDRTVDLKATSSKANTPSKEEQLRVFTALLSQVEDQATHIAALNLTDEEVRDAIDSTKLPSLWALLGRAGGVPGRARRRATKHPEK